MRYSILFLVAINCFLCMESFAQTTWNLAGNNISSTNYLGTTAGNTQTLQIRTNNTTRIAVLSTGNVGIGTTSPTAALHLKAGTVTAGTAPFKFTSGVNLGTAEAGAMEYNGSALFITVGSPSTARKEIAFADLSNITGTVGVIRGGTGLTSVAAGDLLYGSATNVISRLAAGTNGHVLTLQGGVPVWAAAPGGGGGITTLNSLTASTQTFATGTSGTDFGISSAGSVHTFNLPTASAGARGLLSSADWSAFNSKAPATGGTGYIQNNTTVQASSNFNISGNGTIGSNLVVKGTSIEFGSSSQSGQVVMYLKQQSNPSGNGWNFGYTSFNSSDLYLYGHESAAFRVYTNTLERFTVSANGNVGINNSNPQAKLDVAGTFKLVDGTQGANKVLTSDANGNASWQTASGGGGGQWTTSVNNIYNNNSGNVGIGNNNPASKLDVNGNLTLTKDAGNYTANSISMLNPINAVNSKLNSGSNGLELFTTTSHPIIIGVNNSSAAALFTNGNFRISPTNPEFNDNGHRLQVDGSVWVNGNVGIGTATPSAKLDVAGSSNFNQKNVFHIRNSTWGNSSAQLTIGYDNDATTDRGLINIAGVSNGFNNGNGSIFNVDFKAPNIFYSTASNVGIMNIDIETSYVYDLANTGGGAGFRYKLVQSNPIGNVYGTYVDIARNVTGAGYATFGHLAKLRNYNETGYGFYADVSNNSGGTGTAYAFYAQSGKSYFADNVGIGTTNPQAKLDVAGTFKLVDGTQGLNKVLTSDANGNASWQPASGGGSSQWTTNGTAIHYNTGNVGIGTNTPGYKLEVAGTARINNSFVVNADGTVGIGNITTYPATGNYKLAVAGNIIAEKVRVKLQNAGWPDYVFDKEYPLPSLKETELFIKQNNHLPGVPSAAEVEKQGLDLGDGQAVLLKKIEELTLHLIEMDKKVGKLILENETLKKKVNQ